MDTRILAVEVQLFLNSATARRLCMRYRTEPAEAMGELFIRLFRRINEPIRNPRAWVRALGAGYLRNFLRSECRELVQQREVYP